MPNPQKLTILTELREAAGLTLTQMARRCGLTGKQSRLTAGAWERGEYAPVERRRTRVIGYLWDDLGLRSDPTRFEGVWEVLVQEWGWAPIEDAEWNSFTNQARPRVRTNGVIENDVTIANATVAPFQAPAGIPHFVGRREELQSACALLTNENGPSIVALIGMGGIGKTTLAIHAAHALRPHFVDGILWANAAIANPLDIAQSWAQAYGYDFSGLSDLESRAAALRTVLAAKRVLLIFDDVLDAANVRPLLPGGAQCRVLLTTRNHDVASALNAHSHQPAELTSAAGVDLLAQVVGAERVHAELDAARRICTIVEGLPLAVEIVAQRLKSRPRQSLENMVARLEDSAHRLDLQISDRAIRAAFAVSWAQLDDEQKHLFATMGVFEGRSFAMPALAYVAERDEADVEEIVWSLQALSLVGADGGARYRQHPLLADFAGQALGRNTCPRLRLAEYYLAFSKENQINYTLLEPEWENISLVIAAAHCQANWQLVLSFVELLYQTWLTRGRYADICQACQFAQDAAKALGDDASHAQILLWWGTVCVEQNSYEEAQELLSASLILAYDLEEGAGIADAQYQLARLATEQCRYEEAERALTECEEIRHHLADPLKLAELYFGRAWLCFDHGPDYAAAETFAKQALRIQEAAGTKEQRAQTLYLLAQIATEQKQFDRALAYAEKSRMLCELCHSKGDLAAVLYVLVIIHRSLKNHAAAQEYAQQSLELLQHLGIQRIEGMVLRQLSLIYKELQGFEQALTLAEKSYQIFHTLADNLGIAYALRNIGDLYALQNNRTLAKRTWLEVKAIADELQHQYLLESVHDRLASS